MTARNQRHYGVTLMELLVAMSISSLLCVVLVMVIITATRLWYRCSAHSQSFPDAAVIMLRITHELKCAANNSITVSNAYAPSTKNRESYQDEEGNALYDTLTFALPLQSERILNPRTSYYHSIQAINNMPIVAGKEISYYPLLHTRQHAGDKPDSDTNHNGMQDNGEEWSYELHRRETDLTTGSVTSDRVIATNAVIPTFYAYGEITGRVYAVYASVITLLGQQGATRTVSSFNTIIDIRNSAIPRSAQ